MQEIKDITAKLQELDFEVNFPIADEINTASNGENLTKQEKVELKIHSNAIKEHYNKIAKSDAILVLNYSKKNIDNYIGGNTFLEMGFAFVLGKKIFLLNDVPEMLYTDELKAMQPLVINGDLKKIVM